MGWGTGTDEDGCGRKFLVCSDRDLWALGGVLGAGPREGSVDL